MRFKLPSRMKVTGVLLFIQMAAIATGSVFVIAVYPIIWYFGFAISLLALAAILKKDDESAYKITWIAIVLIFPAVGGVIYFIFGNKRPVRRIAAHAQEHALTAKLLDSDGNLPFIDDIKCNRFLGLMQYIRKASSYHAYKNTEVEYFPLGEQMFTSMLEELEKAERFIFIEYFIIKKGSMWQEVLEILKRKAAQGVDVRLIVDDLGSQQLFSKAYIRQLSVTGIKVLRFNPMVPILLLFMNNRDHRKIMVVDGKTAFTGGMNISDEYINRVKRFGRWKDTGVKLKGEAVWSFTLMFIEMWDTFCHTSERINDHISYSSREQHRLNADEALAHGPKPDTDNSSPDANDLPDTDGFVLPFGDSPLDYSQLGEDIYIDILNQAERYVYIFTPYLIISEKMIHALQMAAGRGVDVRIVTPGTPDKKFIFRLTRSYYSYLLKAGIKIYEYTPGFMHAKSFVCDDEIAVVGTINLDYRSLYLHFECAVLMYQSSAVADIKEDALKSISESREVFPTERKWSISNDLSDLLDSVLHLFAPLL
ncbi:MAG: phospholipase D-like domain-containing protein [Defluviitaleaceae bacterium]|nr:phospholipase D-like domain-containing protein [Defluviitaleaceae bacterium]